MSREMQDEHIFSAICWGALLDGMEIFGVDREVIQLYNHVIQLYNSRKGACDMKKLPEAEFEVMNAVWGMEPPATTAALMQALGHAKGWKTPALIALVNRLIERGFLRSEKPQKEREYYPLVTKEDYLQFETDGFLSRYHDGSLTSLMASLMDARRLDEGQLAELITWAKERGD